MPDENAGDGENIALPGGNVPVHHFVPGIRPPAPLNLQSSKTENWLLWKQQWGNYTVISHLDTTAAVYQTSMLLNSIGTDALKIYNGFVFEDEANRTVKDIIEKFDAYIIGDLHETMERYNFNCREQEQKDNFDEYLTALRYLMKSCNFCKCLSETLLRDRIVMGIRSEETRKTLLNIRDLTLAKCIDICRTDEATDLRLKHVNTSGGTAEVHGVKPHKQNNRKKTRGQSGQPQDCIFCAGNHIFGRKHCPAWGERCAACNGRNHLEVACKKTSSSKKTPRTKKVRAVQENDSESDESQYEVINGVKEVSAVNQKLLLSVCG